MYLDKLTIAVLCVAVSGCSLWETKPVEVVTEEIPRLQLNLSQPAPLKLSPIKWVVITPDNVDAVWAELAKNKTDTILFGLTDEEYKQLALDYAKIRALVEEQRAIIVQYKQYYESPK